MQVIKRPFVIKIVLFILSGRFTQVLLYTHTLTLGRIERSDIKIGQLSTFFLNLTCSMLT